MICKICANHRENSKLSDETCDLCIVKYNLNKCDECVEYFPQDQLQKCLIENCSNLLCLECLVEHPQKFCSSCEEFGCRICLKTVKDTISDRLFLCEKCQKWGCLDCAAIVYCQAVECYCSDCSKFLEFSCQKCDWKVDGPEFYQLNGVICIDSGTDQCHECHDGYIDFKLLTD